jgi:D-alanyl-D-alanine carboxypeptidase
MIVSGHRSTDYQQGLYDKQVVDNYVAVPGHSEHHTGYAVDLKVFTSKQTTVEFRDDEQAWMEANCADYGFVVRYDGAKFDLTGILDETWHFRYVGKPHAQYMTENGLCLEEYITLMSTTYNIETCEAPLSYTVGEGNEQTEYEIYYVPASLDSITEIPVPKADTVKDISISGDNVNGFIVTITK